MVVERDVELEENWEYDNCAREGVGGGTDQDGNGRVWHH